LNLVTGATGIIGSHTVLQLLKSGQEVIACRQKNSNLAQVRRLFSHYLEKSDELFAQIKWIELDIRDSFAIQDALANVEHVYHCAGLVSFNTKDKKRLYEMNELGTRNMVNALLEKKTAKLCHVSSLATLHNLDYRLLLDENVFWKKSGKESVYAISKYNAEREVWRGMEEGLDAVIVNPGVVLAAGFWNQSSSKLIKRGSKGNFIYTNGTTGYISAIDAANIMILLLEKQLFGNRFVLVENNYNYHQIFSMINKGFGRSAPKVEINRFWLKTAAFAESMFRLIAGGEPILTKAVVNSAFNKQHYSNNKVRETLHYKFERTELVIAQICDIFKEDFALK
jgi:dihydroflavonol-4-reductase